MSCAEFQQLIHAALDGELDAARAASFERHLATCPRCASAYEDLAAMKMAIRAPTLRYRAPEALRARIEAATIGRSGAPARESARPPSAVRAPGPLARLKLSFAGFGFAMGLVASLLVFLIAPGDQGRLEQAFVANHVRSLLVDHLTDVTSSDQHTVKPWFNGKVDISPPVTDLAADGFPLVGGRLDYVEGHVVAALVYKRRAHVINLFVWPAPGRADRAPALSTLQGYSLLQWMRAGLSFWAVSDLNPAELEEFERLYRAAPETLPAQ